MAVAVERAVEVAVRVPTKLGVPPPLREVLGVLKGVEVAG